MIRRHLPTDFERTARIFVESLGPPETWDELSGMAPFRYLPHVFYVAKWGLDHFEASMLAQLHLTQRFSAEFSIRAFIDRYPRETHARLLAWTRHPSHHVRRLVSEGTRPRLPWAPRLRSYQADPAPVLALLEHLKDDPSLYVRRSVANNLNDIAKDHPEVAVATCRAWSAGATPERRWIIAHALRSLIKAGHPGALEIMGCAAAPAVAVEGVRLTPSPVAIGTRLTFDLVLRSLASQPQELLVDYAVHFVKAGGNTSRKVFKLRRLTLAAGEPAQLRGGVSFAIHTTRRPYPGRHRLELLVNGVGFPLGEVDVVEALRPSAG